MVQNIFSILYQRQTSILSSAVIIMATVVLSKILGLIRDRLLVHTFPPDTVAIFFAAFRLPDLIFQLIIFGALSVAFIPVFTEYLEKKDRKEAFELAQSVLNLAILILFALTVIVFIFADPLTNLIVPGFNVYQKAQVAQLTRIILVGQLILTVGSFFIGILQSFQRFIIPALAGVFYNLGIIIGILFLSKPLWILGPAVGVIIGSVLHVLVQLPLVLSMGFKFSLNFSLFHPGVKEITKLMSFRTIGLAAEQINETVGLILASLIGAASVTYLTFAQHLQIVPVGLFGATLAQAALPVLSSEKSRGRMDEFKATLLTTLHQILFLALPAAAILIILRIPSVRLVFGASEFNWEATVLTGRTLGLMSVGLAAQAVSLLLVRGFYAIKDTRTPVFVSLVVVFVNIILSFYFVRVLLLDVWSLGLAFSISAILSGLLLFWTLHFKIGGFDLKEVFIPLSKMLMATIIMGASLYIPVKLLDQVIFDTTRTVNLLILTGLASVFALSIYIFLVWFMGVRELETFLNLTKRIISKLKASGPKVKTNEFIHDTEAV
ncbi:murein biosynthesis integral membrane protein MurJ [Candidatus Daviesbacteria bacterium RIFCSPHIGHO2_12_FULL_37_11]|uniref:Probable lipid II flippase MurJ n=1 Tax=Candidatus Daviesbacteria bacterium RIFCSPHIGHO2_12_FULL_37_11 TaxID=1797777 RepID=A0A1F5KDQ4_9BACT|nr:MAG: murein biosynthesis integral membrane protein MurJ [Candidatus Daviesbacteria bacterium GWA1_38_6]OGE17997.1 MAG: murein biosynthesis integral membrane protein MurJ [Candidatus Daviesbacteria bacterium RIFCSPHIGHO2_01_FULL_37_27]OGE38731.1 MAG: murein biosynthesis integral membrane protein MurJ [Candidatus Daviesbacteria bacterium RIFCSPHIGHO2_12_FULL_37_11]OGE45820.1 MAG: murein biosynthesis integral membrane protein MurJ [Candidatus Daviesbacteria bacterium RIFCSPLOWO2_01_FULL_37_10]